MIINSYYVKKKIPKFIYHDKTIIKLKKIILILGKYL